MSSLPFRPGKLRIEGIDVVRATVAPSSHKDHIDWIIDVLRSPDVNSDDPFLAIADFHIVEEGHLIGVTLSAFVVLPLHVSPTTVPIEPLKRVVAELYEAVFWSLARSTVRQLSALANLQDANIPLDPPPVSTGHKEVDYVVSADPEDDGSASK